MRDTHWLLPWSPTYEIRRGEQLLATVMKETFTLFSCTSTVDVPDPDDLQAEGDFLDLEYELRRGEPSSSTWPATRTRRIERTG